MSIPRGIITAWFGSIASIPAGWVICDGNNDTPDLRNRFVAGAGGIYAVDDTGGALTHAHPFTADTHDHTIPVGADLAPGANLSATVSDTVVTGTTDASSSLPLFHALAFIMKT